MKSKKHVLWMVMAAAAFVLVIAAPAAHAALSAAGPVSPATGFPEWYRDVNGAAGHTLQLCLDQNNLCVLPVAWDPAKTTPPASITNLASSITNTNFPDFSYYWIALSRMDIGTDRFDLELSLDATFKSANRLAQNGTQVTALNVIMKPMTGLTPDSTYTVRHPFGQFSFTTDAAGNTGGFKLTDGGDIGIFTTLLPAGNTQIGPFLIWDTGFPVVVGGEYYIGDPHTPHTVIGGTARNVVQVTGPGVNVTNANFLVAGKLIALTASPATLTFPLQNGAAPSAPQIVTVTNVTGAALTVGAITSTNANFTVPALTNACTGVSVPASGTCTFEVVFLGTAPDGLKTGTINIAAPAGNPGAKVAVSGSLDSTPPGVSSTFPAAGATAPSNSAITVTFSEVVTNITNQTFTLSDGGGAPVAGGVALDTAGKTAQFTPSAPLAVPGNFTATVAGGAGGVTDIAGNALAANFTLNFATAVADTIAPTVVSKTPAADAVDVNPTLPVTVTFSEAMDPVSVNETTFTLSGGVTAAVTFDQATKTATLTPSAPLALGTLYTATVATGIQDLAQNPLAAAETWRFLTDAGPSVPQLISPANDATGIPAASVSFEWTKSTDPDGDVITYHLYVCRNPQMIGCSAQDVTQPTAQTGTPLRNSLAGYGAGVFLIGAVIGLKGRKKILLLLAALAVTGTLVSSCSKSSGGGGGGGGGGGTTPAPVSFTLTNLGAGTKYYWKVTADDGNGALVDSEIRSFTTQ